ncbi:hypothetical protein HNP84_009755 [Thermocatellispora tengchongensis]|uniref:Uncharacterized protein n=1 Tax=Thermocatellispora tengchongensis TaxID=1073253 RepID=A0A840PQF4_9ACTN|nr:hypothetical protein [Thermocatellispora tengchongensis]MBB5139990.1 hypothetical protein [Thermocatellispora tengchongensis]
MITHTSHPPIDVHVTPRGRIIMIPAVWPPELDADDADLLAERLTAAAEQSRARTDHR